MDRPLISGFFDRELGAPLNNTRWSWGAINKATGQLFLRVWTDEREPVKGIDCISILNNQWQGASSGLPERRVHVELLKNGAEGYGVLCVPRDSAKGRNIASFDDRYLLRFGHVVEIRGHSYASIAGQIAVEEITRRWTASNSLLTDLEAIAETTPGETSRRALLEARIGQGQFRRQVLSAWGDRCCVTGSMTLEAVRASHIKPWRHCDNRERLDPCNGLPLMATLDALFDVGLISFDRAGAILVAKTLNRAERGLLRLSGLRLNRQPSKKTAGYLEYHRSNVFLDGSAFR